MSILNSVIFPNVHEYMCVGMNKNFEPSLLEEWRKIAAGYAETSILWQGKNKMILSPLPIEKEFVQYFENHFDFNIDIVSPSSFTSNTSMDFLNDHNAMETIKKFVHEHNSPYFLTWGGTKGAYLLLNELNHQKKCHDELPKGDAFWTVHEFDSKIGFKKICEKLKIQTPKSLICEKFSSLRDCVRIFSESGCIIKANHGAGGFGNIFVPKTLMIESDKKLDEFLENSILELPYFRDDNILVEEVVEKSNKYASGANISSGFASAQILENGQVKIIAGGIDMHNRFGYYEGAYMGKDVFPKKLWDELVNILYKIGDEISKQGYIGHWGINYMLDKKGQIQLIEMNTRRCGESHVHNMANIIAGEQWMNTKFVLNRFPLDVEVYRESITSSEILGIFEKLNKEKRDTVLIPVQLSWLQKKRFKGIGYMIIGDSHEKVKMVDNLFLQHLDDIGVRALL